MFQCVFTMVAANRSLGDVDEELCFGGLISVAAELMFEACSYDNIVYVNVYTVHTLYAVYTLKPTICETMLFLNVIVSES